MFSIMHFYVLEQGGVYPLGTLSHWHAMHKRSTQGRQRGNMHAHPHKLFFFFFPHKYTIPPPKSDSILVFWNQKFFSSTSH